MGFPRYCLLFLLWLFSYFPPLFQIDLISQLSRILWFPRCCFPVASRFFHVLSSYLQLVCWDWVLKLPSNCFGSLWLWQFRFVPRLRPPIISTSLPFVALLFLSCFFRYLSPSCLVLILQIWSFNCFRVSCRCVFPILSQLFSTYPLNAQLSSRSSPPMILIISQLFSNCFRAASQMWSSNCLPIVCLSFEFEWVTCIWLLVPDTLDFSC